MSSIAELAKDKIAKGGAEFVQLACEVRTDDGPVLTAKLSFDVRPTSDDWLARLFPAVGGP